MLQCRQPKNSVSGGLARTGGRGASLRRAPCAARRHIPVRASQSGPGTGSSSGPAGGSSSSSSGPGGSSNAGTPGASSSSSSSSSPSTALLAPAIFGSLEQLLARSFSSSDSGLRGDWQEVEACWVLRPPAGVAAEAVIHFLGGAFVGAAPQLSYRRLLENLAARGALVIATPFATSFDQLRAADEVQYHFERCQRALQVELGSLPVFGVGHSMGALLHMLINARYAVKRDGNVLMSYNNKPATDSIPFLSPFLAPSARAVGTVLEQLATSPLRPGLENVTDMLRGLSPAMFKQLMPIFEQLNPIYIDVAQGRQEFSPTPDEMKTMIRNFYAVQRNLILRFKQDTIDESIGLAQLLQTSSAISGSLDLSLRTLDGDHVRPMAQAFVDLPPEVARVGANAVQAGGSLLGRLADLASSMGVSQASQPLEDLSKGVNNMANLFGQDGASGPAAESTQQLADEIAAWIGIGDVVGRGKRALPAASEVNCSPAGAAVD